MKAWGILREKQDRLFPKYPAGKKAVIDSVEKNSHPA